MLNLRAHEAALNLVRVIPLHIILRVASQLSCSCSKFREVRHCFIWIFCSPCSHFLSRHCVSVIFHFSVVKSFRLNGHLIGLSARQPCSGCSITTLDKGTHTIMYMQQSVTTILTSCGCRIGRDTEAGLPINIRQPKSDSSVLSTSSGSLPPPLEVSVHTTIDKFGDQTLNEKGMSWPHTLFYNFYFSFIVF